jgi:hypothetical protein
MLRSDRITAEEGELPPLETGHLNFMYTDSFVVSVGPISRLLMLWPRAACSRRRYVTAPCSTGRTRRAEPGGRRESVLEAQRRRVGRVDEDGPEDLHVLAGARLDVLVQDVDAPLCSSSSHSRQHIRT